MQLNKLSLVNFKNYKELSLELSPQVNCFVGNNGMGKTNVLDAIYYLANCKSFFNASDAQNINFEEEFFVIQGEFELADTENIYCGVKKGKKKVFKRGKNEYEKLSEHIGLINTVLISPIDGNLITEGSEIRRKYIDYIISQYNKPYLKDLIAYNKALTQRNALLKHFIESRSFNEGSLEVWNDQLASYGNKVFEERNKFIKLFTPIFQEVYHHISNGKEEVKLLYKSQLSEGDFDVLLKQSTQKDRYSGYTNTGIHKDDFLFKLGDKSLKKFGSQGQQKTFVLALKLAHYKLIEKEVDKKPILLLDDIYDKLDANRIDNLMKSISKGEYGQVFITDTDDKRLKNIFKKKEVDFKQFSVNDGELVKK